MKKSSVMFFVLATIAALLLMFILGCSNSSTVSIRRITITGDNASLVGTHLTESLRWRNARISEGFTNGPVLTGKSTITPMEHGVSVFKLEITDGKGTTITETVSTQDVAVGDTITCINEGVNRAADAIIKQLAPKQPIAPRTPEHYSTS